MSNNCCSLFQVDHDMTDNMYIKEKKPQNQVEEHLKSLEEEYTHIREDWRITRGTEEEVS